MNPIAAADLARQQHSEQHRAAVQARLVRVVVTRRQAGRAEDRARSAATRAERAGEAAVPAVAR
jgi:hypothetical protein